MGYKITASPVGQGDGVNFVLADESLGRSIGCRSLVSISPSFDAALRREPYFRGDAPEVLNGPDGNNDECRFEIVVCYCFASEAEKILFACDMQLALPHKANLEIICDGSVRVVAGAWLRPVTTEQDFGTTWLARITALGGRITITVPK